MGVVPRSQFLDVSQEDPSPQRDRRQPGQVLLESQDQAFGHGDAAVLTKNQGHFNRAVARVTGESVETIARRGFVLLTPVPFEREPRYTSYDDFLGDACTSTRPQARNRAAE
jgi:hypothetical protein